MTDHIAFQIESNTKSRRRIQHKSKKFKTQFKKSRTVFRIGAFCLYVCVVGYTLFKSNSLSSFEDSSSSRVRRSAESENSVCKNKTDVNLSDKTETDEWTDCLYNNVWSNKCVRPDDFSKVFDNSKTRSKDINDWLATHTEDLTFEALNQAKWLNKEGNDKGYDRGDARLNALCCMGGERKHSLHNGPIDEFPKTNLFTHQEIKSGFWLIHLFVSLYMFAALAIVCDDYFVPALERLSEELQLSEDVAGATFMAAGSSAPELFTSVIGVFVAKSDIGIGTIVGSAVFNILVIIGACGLFVK